MSFKMRVSSPNKFNKWWISSSTNSGGCNPVKASQGNSVLPNPVGYVHGRFDEIMNSVSNLSCGAPGQLYLFTEDGYQRGTNPQLGSVICWSSFSTDGHVAIVEKIEPDGTIITSEYSQTTKQWTSERRMPPSYTLTDEYHLIFQGFIYNPSIKGTTDAAETFLVTALRQVGTNATWTIKNSGLQSSGWSAMFIVACAKIAGILDKLIYKSSSATTLVEMSTGMRMGQWILHTENSRPQKCDIIGFRFSPNKDDNNFTCDKLGIVYNISKDNIECIVGDTSGRVKLVKYSPSNKSIKGYFRPNWISQGANVLNFVDYNVSSNYRIDSTDQDCMMKEVGYLNSSYEPSITPSDLKLCCVNYTDMLSDIYEKIDSSLEEMMDKEAVKMYQSTTVVNLTGMIGHASKNEFNGARGGVHGDQTGQEVYIRNWYSNSWTHVLRFPNEAVAGKMCKICQDGCNNANIGYDQNTRNSLHNQARAIGYDLTRISTPCSTDCSAYMTVCAIGAGVSGLEYTGNAPTTRTMVNAFSSAGFQVLTDPKYLVTCDYLIPGDIIVSTTKGHTVMCLGYGKCTPGYGKSSLSVGVISQNVGVDYSTLVANSSGVKGNAALVIEYCMGKGLNYAASCAIAANIKHESNYKTNAVGDKGTSFGLCQWHNERGERMKTFVGPNWASNFTGQMDYLWYELTHSYKGVYSVLVSVSDDGNGLITATDKWIRSYEVPQGYDDPTSPTYVNRRKTAQSIYTGVA